MKTIMILSIMVLLSTVPSCNSLDASTSKNENKTKTSNDGQTTEIVLSAEESSLVDNNNCFAFNLMKKISDKKSIIVSPIGITYALGMLSNGAVGETSKQINSVLGFNTTDETNAFCKKMMTEAPKFDDKTKILTSSTIFVNKKYEIKKDFVKKAKDYYGASPESRNFADGKTLKVINKWARDHTENMIEEVLDEQSFNPSNVSYLLNAIYFKGSWAAKFDKELTSEKDFNGKGKVMMMRQKNQFMYADNAIYQSLEMPYGNGSYRITVLLPHKDKTINDILDTLNGKQWKENISMMSKCNVIVEMPRFETNTDIDLKEVMSNLGMPLAFTSGANFDNFCKSPTYIDLMKQVAKIKLDEEGTEAAAVTVIGMRKNAMARPEKPVEFIANRPFVYVISERTTEAIFFIGQFTGK